MLRSSTALALVGALGLASLSLAACNKKPADSANPDAGAAGSSTPAGGGIVLRYKPTATRLKENLNVSFSNSGGGQTGAMKSDFSGLLDIKPQGTDKLRVDYSVTDVRAFELTGNMNAKPKDGKPAPDYKAQFLTAKGALIVDLLGDTDKAATKALPENAPKKDGAEDEFDVSGFGSFLGLPPELPKDGLVEGKPLKVSKEDKQNFFGAFEIDMEVETTYTLVKIDTSSGKRIADIKVESESSGAKELSQGGQNMMLSIDTTSEATFSVNLDDMLPIRSHIESTTNFNAGAQGGGETRIVMDATYEPAT